MSKTLMELLQLTGMVLPRSAVVSFCEPADVPRDAIYKGLLDGTYTKPFLVEDSGYLSLCFALDGSAQTEMSLMEPDALASEYTRKMMGFLVFQPQPKEVVLLGLGGGALAKFCHRHLPTTRITAVEINADVIGLRSHFRLPPDDERLRVIEGDGAHYVAQLAERGEQVDALLVDAYNHAGIARGVVTCTFLERAKQVIGESGVLVMNLVDDVKHCLRYVEKIRQVFDKPVIVITMRESGNWIVFAGQALADSKRLTSAMQNVAHVENRLGLHFPRLFQRLYDLAEIRPAGMRRSYR